MPIMTGMNSPMPEQARGPSPLQIAQDYTIATRRITYHIFILTYRKKTSMTALASVDPWRAQFC